MFGTHTYKARSNAFGSPAEKCEMMHLSVCVFWARSVRQTHSEPATKWEQIYLGTPFLATAEQVFTASSVAVSEFLQDDKNRFYLVSVCVCVSVCISVK